MEMVSDFKKWGENYIISIPSGEVIYASSDNISMLRKQNYVFYDDNRGVLSLKHWVCNDYFSQIIKSILKDVNKDVSSIENFLEDWGLLKDQYRIYDDMSVDAMGPVNMAYKGLRRIPVKFNRCTSDFNCSYNKLTTLVNSPRTIHGKFDCSYNKLTTLIGGPRLISKLYNCSHNNLTTFEGSPVTVSDFNCSHNFLSNLNKAPKVLGNFIKNDNAFNNEEF